MAARDYCRYCGEHIETVDGAWVGTDAFRDTWCRMNKGGHAEVTAEEYAREALEAKHDEERIEARWRELTRDGTMVAPSY